MIRWLNPVRILAHLWGHRLLIYNFTKRHVIGRYKGSYLGMAWSFIQPLVMLCIYTFVFSVIFQAKWDVGPQQSRTAFAMTLFAGLIAFNIFAESANEAPSVILAHVNFVKKVVFPLEILPVVILLSAVVNSMFSMIILAGTLIVIGHPIFWTVLLIPIIWLPLMLLSLGVAYFLASLGVFIRDMGATVSLVTTVLFFLSPIFYPLSAVPEAFQTVIRLNPIAIFVENARRVILWGRLPDWPWYFGAVFFSVIVFICGFIWFYKSKNAFADVI